MGLEGAGRNVLREAVNVQAFRKLNRKLISPVSCFLLVILQFLCSCFKGRADQMMIGSLQWDSVFLIISYYQI